MLRFAAPGQWDSRGLPTSAALSLKADEDGLSIYLRDLLQTKSLDERDVVTGRPTYGVFGIPAAIAITNGCTVEHDPVVRNPTSPIDFAHALIMRIADKAQWKLVRAA